MNPRLLIDMNLSPEWAPALQRHGWEAVHLGNVVIAALNQHQSALSSGRLFLQQGVCYSAHAVATELGEMAGALDR